MTSGVTRPAVGSSQVGAIFSHWTGPEPVEVYSLAGMKTLDYELYRDEIAARNPQRVVLYLSAFDLTAGPELTSLPLAPSHPSRIWPTLARLHASGIPYDGLAGPAHEYVASQFLPEYRYRFVFRGFLKELAEAAPFRTAAGFFVPTLHAAEPAAPTIPAADAEVLARFRSYYVPEWLDYNMGFLRSFVRFCRDRGIDVVIVEGQVSPVVANPQLDRLGAMVRGRFSELALLYPNVKVVPASDTYQFTVADYNDFTHVHQQAAQRYTGQLAALLGRVGPPPLTSPCDLTFASGWHGAEGAPDGWLRWASGTGVLRLRSRTSRTLVLDGRWLSLARPNEVSVLANEQALGQWAVTDPAWAFHDVSPVTVRVEGGQDVLVQLVSRAPATAQPTDPRPLTFAVSNLRLTSEDGTACTVTQ